MFKCRPSGEGDKVPAIAQLVERPTVVEIAAIGRSLVRIRVAGRFLLPLARPITPNSLTLVITESPQFNSDARLITGTALTDF